MASLPRAHPSIARASRVDLTGSVSDINDYFDQQGWTDGLPIIPPTEDLVSSMLEASPAPAEQVLGQLPPRNGTVTVEKVAINAVMAGCQPAYFPVVLAAVKADVATPAAATATPARRRRDVRMAGSCSLSGSVPPG